MLHAITRMKVPLELLNLHDDGFHLLVEVVVFGQRCNAVLDTGASKTVLDKSTILDLIEQEDLLTLSDKLSTGLGTTTMESFTITIPDFRIGSLKIPKLETVVIDLSNINDAYDKMNFQRVIGVIGGDILMNYKAVIDYGKLTLSLTKK
jgi:predicted aspartyl protease